MICIGDIVRKKVKFGFGDKTTTRSTYHRFEVLGIYPKCINDKKDVILCKDIEYGYKECFFRMDLEGDEEECL